MTQEANAPDSGEFLTLEMLVFENDNRKADGDMAECHGAGLAYGAAMLRELEDMQEALDEIAQCIVY